MAETSSLRVFCVFTGDPGHPGLPGLPGSYTVQSPSRVQKRDTGKIKMLSNPIRTIRCNIHITHHCTVFFHPLQAIKWLVVVSGIAVRPTVAKGLTYYWIMSDFVFTFTHLFFRCSTLAMQVVKKMLLIVCICRNIRRRFEKIKAAKNASVSLKRLQ